MEKNNSPTNTGKKSLLVKVIIVVVIAFLAYYAFSGLLSGFGEAFSE